MCSCLMQPKYLDVFFSKKNAVSTKWSLIYGWSFVDWRTRWPRYWSYHLAKRALCRVNARSIHRIINPRQSVHCNTCVCKTDIQKTQLVVHVQACVRSVHEPSQDPGPRDRRRPLRRHLGVLRRADMRDGGRRVGLQPHTVHGQAAARDHPDLVLLEECKEELAGSKITLKKHTVNSVVYL